MFLTGQPSLYCAEEEKTMSEIPLADGLRVPWSTMYVPKAKA